MKRILLALIAIGFFMTGSAQKDSTKQVKDDTIRVGGMIIIKRDDGSYNSDHHTIVISNRPYKPSNISTNWWIMDFGVNSFVDNTNYGSPDAQAFAPGLKDEDGMELTGNSVNINLWIFMQRLNVYKHVVNLKYGMGLELNNYHFDDKKIRFLEDPTQIVMDSSLVGAKKNKLAADYLTVPLMLNFNFTPSRRKGFGFSVGVSAGYLYSSRQKIKIDSDKYKVKDDFNLRRWKISYIGEINLGIVKFYGSYATQSMWEKGLDQTPFNVGLRLGNW
jgi:hypothetical protein